MRLLILSDLHHELWREHVPRIDAAVSKPDLVILAGDINTGAKAVTWAAQNFAGLPVVYVHGNHEGYGDKLDTVQDEIMEASLASGNARGRECHERLQEHPACQERVLKTARSRHRAISCGGALVAWQKTR